MSVVENLLASLYEKNIAISVVDAKMKLKAPEGVLTPEILAQLKQHKAELLSLLLQLEQSGATLSGAERIMPIERKPMDWLSVSFSQQRSWLLEQVNHGSASENMPCTLEITGKFDLHIAECAIQKIVARHEVLRTRYQMQGDTLVQRVCSGAHFTLQHVSLLHLNASSNEVLELIEVDKLALFDLSKDLLVRALCIELKDSVLLQFTMHHIASDGWSQRIWMNEFIHYYQQISEGKLEELPALPIQYVDYAAWQRTQLSGDVFDSQLHYWSKQLEDAPTLHSLPLQKVRPSANLGLNKVVTHYYDKALTSKLQRGATDLKLTMFMLLHGALSLVLSRHSNITDILIGTAVANRPQAELESLIGAFTNTLVLRANTNYTALSDYLTHIRQVNLDAQAHQDVPFSEVIEHLKVPRTPQHAPLFQIMFTMDTNDSSDASLSDVAISRVESDVMVDLFDLDITAEIEQGRLKWQWLYDESLFDRAYIDTLNSHLENIVTQMVTRPDAELGSLPMLSDEETHELVIERNDTFMALPDVSQIQHLIEQSAVQTPDAIALSYGAQQLTYQELDQATNQLAHYLVSCGVTPSKPVAVCFDRSLAMIVAIIGVLKSGAAYVPIDPKYPAQRIQYILEDSCASQILLDEQQDKLRELFPERCITLTGIFGTDYIQSYPTNRPEIANISAHNLAYIIYTSGSTGTPKGVEVEHASLLNSTLARAPVFVFPERFLLLHSVAFDSSVAGIFYTLCHGGQLCIGDDLLTNSAESLIQQLSDKQITFLETTPTLLDVLLDMLGTTQQPYLNTIVIAGEAFSKSLVEKFTRWSAQQPQQVELINEYGPTETTVWSSVAKLTLDNYDSIGHAIANTQLYIVDYSNNLAPKGAIGELWVGGDNLARGYHNNNTMTAQKFIANPFAKSTSARVYRTGDLVRYLDDGQLQFIGRVDDQVKIRGYRVELGEIQNKILDLEGVQSSALLIADKNAQKHLEAYVVAHDKQAKVTFYPPSGDHFLFDQAHYTAMLRDVRRNACFQDAMNKTLKGKVVLEIGPGAELVLTQMALKAGAKKIIAVEINPEAYEQALAKVHELALTDRVDVLLGDIQSVELPEQPEFCISELIGTIGSSEGAGDILNSVRPRLANPENMLPKKCVTKIAAVNLSEEHCVFGFNQIGNTYKDDIYRLSGSEFDLRLCADNVTQAHLVSDVGIFEELDFTQQFSANNTQALRLQVTKSGRLTGFVAWVNIHLDDEIVLDVFADKQSSFLPNYFPLDLFGTEVNEGDVISGEIERLPVNSGFGHDYILNLTIERKDVQTQSLSIVSAHNSGALNSNSFYQKFNQVGVVEFPEPHVSAAQVRQYLAQILPSYMVPSHIHLVDEIPLNSHGKVDKAALRAKSSDDGEKVIIEPKNETQHTLLTIWSEVLGIEKAIISCDDDFFELGGHSLLAVRLSNEIAKHFNKAIRISSLFEHVGIIKLAHHIDAMSEQHYELPKVQPDLANRYEPFALNDIQRAYWIGRRDDFEMGNVGTHGYFEKFAKNLDLQRLETAWNALIRRHDMLRMVVDGEGIQRVLKQTPYYQFKVYQYDDEIAANAGQLAVRKEISHTVYSGREWPLFDVRITQLNEQDSVIHFSSDALIVDGSSSVILFDELFSLYCNPELKLASLNFTFRDYVMAYQELRDSPLFKKSKKYWQDRVASFPDRPMLPTSMEPESITEPHFSRVTHSLTKDQWQTLKQLAAERQITPTGLFLGAFSWVLSHWCESKKFALNLTLFNRLPLHPEVNKIIGDFTTLSLLEVDLSDTSVGFASQVKGIQKQLWQDLDHRHFGGIDMQKALSSHCGQLQNFPVVVTSTIGLEAQSETDVSPEVLQQQAIAEETFGNSKDDFAITQTSQVWLDVKVNESQGELNCAWDHVEELFPKGMVADIAQSLDNLLIAMTENHDVWESTLLLPLPEQQNDLIKSVNNTACEIELDYLHSAVVRQMQRRGDAVAIYSDDKIVTYEQLWHFTTALAWQLQQNSVKPGELVAIVMDKCWQQVVAAIGVCRSGAAYLPIDANLPQSRIELLLKSGRVTQVVTAAHCVKLLPEAMQLHIVEQLVESTLPAQAYQLECGAQLSDLAYVIFTSGSTGAPKGVMIEHAAANNTCVDINQRFAVTEQDSVLALSNLNFDLSVYDIFGVLGQGGALVLPKEDEIRDPASWLRYITNHQITIWNTVPALMVMLTEHLKNSAVRLPICQVLMSGDWIPLDLPNKIKAIAPNVKITSLGGATEASIWSIFYEIDQVLPHWKSVPYGKALANQAFYVLDQTLEPAPVWAVGDLYIGGVGLARGYFEDCEKTNHAFIHHPESGNRLYRTGDRGRLLPDGNIEFLGRIDHQVKVQGYRIELGEVEAHCKAHEDVDDAVVTTFELHARKWLVAFVTTGNEQQEALRVALKAHLSAQLPHYMVPQHIHWVAQIPLTANGKVDHKALARLAVKLAVSIEGDDAHMLTPAEKKLAILWASLLNLPVSHFDSHSNFFALGGDSIFAVRLVAEIEKAYNTVISIADIFQNAELSKQVAVIEAQGTHGYSDIRSLPVRSSYPVSPSQKSMFMMASMDKGSLAYNVPFVIKVEGQFDLDKAQYALTQIVQRHEVFRTTFNVDAQGEIYQTILNDVAFDVQQQQVTEQVDIESLIQAFIQPFELAKAPLLRAKIVSISFVNEAPRRWLLLLDMHHIISDGVTMNLFVHEFAKLYEGESLQPLRVQYKDYSDWLNKRLASASMQKQRAYWLEQLSGRLPQIQLPADFSRPAVKSSQGAHILNTFDAELTAQVQKFAHQHSCTLFMTMLSCVNILLHKLTLDQDIIVGTAVAGREHTDLQRMMGMFVNMLALRNSVIPSMSVAELVAAVRENTLTALENQQMPFERVVEQLKIAKNPSRQPIFDVCFAMRTEDETQRNIDIAGVQFEGYEPQFETAKYDLTFDLYLYREQLQVRLEYSKDLFSEESASQFLTLFKQVTSQAIADPQCKIEQLDTLQRNQRVSAEEFGFEF
ncbi:D-alanine--D-alanyl carrier protein ligase [Pseudoalteromonas holothuriae]|uniref:D-alanine--D-alanyl carrier protein ligase n=1 Tax=Pseudoalteromonas holothuriae TaxID=2963714 RepID=A0ABN8UP92_9GAMM|nr:non-ribosomal peptide synthetase [Pseudoalteromonas sp. CIP111951]CAH9057856.1 D-alanine--D-alanyl carrier protein ligase [Pseudoalteromonas sp. CIP111951]